MLHVGTILQGSALALLGAYLYYQHRRRVSERRRRSQESSTWNGPAIDVRPLQPRLEKVRHDYLANVHLTPRRLGTREDRLKTIRGLISRLGFFQRGLLEAPEKRATPAENALSPDLNREAR